MRCLRVWRRQNGLCTVAALKEQNCKFIDVEVNEARRFVRHIAPKMAPHYAMPSRLVPLIKLLLHVHRHVTLELEPVQRLCYVHESKNERDFENVRSCGHKTRATHVRRHSSIQKCSVLTTYHYGDLNRSAAHLFRHILPLDDNLGLLVCGRRVRFGHLGICGVSREGGRLFQWHVCLAASSKQKCGPKSSNTDTNKKLSVNPSRSTQPRLRRGRKHAVYVEVLTNDGQYTWQNMKTGCAGKSCALMLFRSRLCGKMATPTGGHDTHRQAINFQNQFSCAKNNSDRTWTV